MTNAAHIQEQIDGIRRELNDLEAATATLNPPLPPHTMMIALAKLTTLQHQIAELEKKLRDARS